MNYGEWPSPIDAADVVAETLSFGDLAVADGVTYWLERRPSEGGRGVVVRSPPPADHDAADGGDAGDTGATDDATSEPPRTDVTPGETDVRTLVHRYGGGAFTVADGTVYYSRMSDGRVCRCPADGSGDGEPITPEPPGEAEVCYADVTVGPDGLYAVRERHHDEGRPIEESPTIEEPVAEIVRVPLAGGEPTVLASGHDFYSFPRPAPDGSRLAWTAWDHPRMPWDGTELYVAPLVDDETSDTTDDGTELTTGEPQRLLGGPDESVFQPSWHDGRLYAVSDRTGWWNLYRVPTDTPDDPEPIVTDDAEYGVPQWVFGLSTYTHLPDGRIAAIRTGDGTQQLGVIDPTADEPAFEPFDLPYSVYSHAHLTSDGERLAFHAGGPTQPRSVVRWTPTTDQPTELRRSASLPAGEAYLPEPTHFTYPTGKRGEGQAYAYYYPPTHPDCAGPADERPPLVVRVHGGPTSRVHPIADSEIAYFTSRGFAVVDCNYRGSTGHGRAYREALDGQWGVADTADCVNVASYLSEWGVVDADRLAIRGGSAGGYAVLSALAFHDTFDAGASYYGVADLHALATHTHKFESRYLDGLVGPLSEARETYAERSPANHADRVSAPLLLLQGGEDEVVPPAQADRMVEALIDAGTPYDYVLFPEERHGFQDAETNRVALESELGFYAAVFGLDREDVPRVELADGEYRRRTPTED